MDTQNLTTLASTALALLWEQCGKELIRDITKSSVEKLGFWGKLKAKKAFTTMWDHFNWRTAAANYSAELKNLYGTTTVLGKAAPIPLEGIFSDVYILDEPSAFRRFKIEELTSDPTALERGNKRIDGVALVKKSESVRLFILGKPGAGKTTFLKYLVGKATEGEINKTPIFVSLKEWADSKADLLPFIYTQFDICGFPKAEEFVHQILTDGTAIVLFDGLDEVKQEDEQRVKTIAQLRDFTHKYNRTQCLITCRIAATSYLFDKFTYVELADFTNEQINIYVNKWFQGQSIKRNRFFKEFEKAENKSLQELARTPLLLSLICLTFDSTMSFPNRRVDLYEEAVETLLKKWDAAREIQRDEIYRGLSTNRKRYMFARIAARSFSDNNYFLSERKLAAEIVAYLAKLPDALPATDIDGVAVLKTIEAQHGIFSERAKQIYSFAHLTFQEYFTARYMTTNGRALQELITAQHIADPRWREVLILTASLLDDAAIYMDLFQQAIDNFIIDDDEICNFLNYIDAKASSVRGNNDSTRLRAFYLCLAFGLIYRDIYYASNTLTFDLNYVRARLREDSDWAYQVQVNNAHAQSLYHVRALIYDLAATLDAGLARTIDESLPGLRLRVQNLTRMSGSHLAGILTDNIRFEIPDAINAEVARSIKQAQAINNGGDSLEDREMQLDLHLHNVLTQMLCNYWSPPADDGLKQYFNIVIDQVRSMGLSKLEKRLTSLVIPESTLRLQWTVFINAFEEIIFEERLIGRLWTPTNDQCAKLIKYFSASLFLLEALEVADVNNRIEIKNKLLVNPRQRRR